MYDTPIPVDRSLSLRLLNRAGAIAERWLFFAEARHAVMAYYGQS